MSLSARSVSSSLLAATSLALAVSGCGREEVQYEPQPSPTVKAALPPVPLPKGQHAAIDWGQERQSPDTGGRQR